MGDIWRCLIKTPRNKQKVTELWVAIMNHAELHSLLRLCAELWISFSQTHNLASFSDVPHLPAHPRCAWRAVNLAMQGTVHHYWSGYHYASDSFKQEYEEKNLS